MAFTVPKVVPEWMKPSRHATETIEQATKLQRQIDEAMGGVTGRMLFDHIERQKKWQRQIDEAMGGATGRMLLDYSNTIFDHLQRLRRAQQAIDMVGLFSDPQTDDDALQDWIDGNRDSLTVEDLQAIILAAMAHGLSEAMSQKQAPRKESRISNEDKIRDMWQTLQASGMTKNSASKTIAEKVSLSAETVRKKLQKM